MGRAQALSFIKRPLRSNGDPQVIDSDSPSKFCGWINCRHAGEACCCVYAPPRFQCLDPTYPFSLLPQAARGSSPVGPHTIHLMNFGATARLRMYPPLDPKQNRDSASSTPTSTLCFKNPSQPPSSHWCYNHPVWGSTPHIPASHCPGLLGAEVKEGRFWRGLPEHFNLSLVSICGDREPPASQPASLFPLSSLSLQAVL